MPTDHIEVANLGQPNSSDLYSHFLPYPPLFYLAHQKTPIPCHLPTLISFCKISLVVLNRITKWTTFLGQLCEACYSMNLFSVQKAWVVGMQVGGVLSADWKSSYQLRALPRWLQGWRIGILPMPRPLLLKQVRLWVPYVDWVYFSLNGCVPIFWFAFVAHSHILLARYRTDVLLWLRQANKRWCWIIVCQPERNLKSLAGSSAWNLGETSNLIFVDFPVPDIQCTCQSVCRDAGSCAQLLCSRYLP